MSNIGGHITLILDPKSDLRLELSPQDPRECSELIFHFSDQKTQDNRPDDHIRERITDIIQAHLEKNGIDTAYHYDEDYGHTFIDGKAKFSAHDCDSYVMATLAAQAMRPVIKLTHQRGMTLEDALEKLYMETQMGGALSGSSFGHGHGDIDISGMVINPHDSGGPRKSHQVEPEPEDDHTTPKMRLSRENARGAIVKALRSGEFRESIPHALAFRLADELAETVATRHSQRPPVDGPSNRLHDTVMEGLAAVEDPGLRARTATAIITQLETAYARVGADIGGWNGR